MPAVKYTGVAMQHHAPGGAAGAAFTVDAALEDAAAKAVAAIGGVMLACGARTRNASARQSATRADLVTRATNRSSSAERCRVSNLRAAKRI
ncbi:MAG: hypothetical protein M3O41_15090 [Pseudomonadota bacterium]|nr:hypothetical protein [Pseudomonadota bacterium]